MKDTAQLSLRLPARQLRELRVKAKAEGMSMGELARLAIFTIIHAQIEYGTTAVIPAARKKE